MEKTKDYQIIQSRLHSWMKATFRTSKSNDTLTCTRCYCRCIKHQADKDVSNIKQRISLLLVCAICCSRWLPACADDLILHSLLLYLPFEPIRRTGCLRLEPLPLALPVACAAIAQALPCVQRCTDEAAVPKQRGKEEHPTRTTWTCARTENRPRKGKQRHTKHNTRRSQKLQESKLNQLPRGQEEEKASFPIDLQYQVSKIHRKNPNPRWRRMKEKKQEPPEGRRGDGD